MDDYNNVCNIIDLSQYPNGYELKTNTLYIGYTYESIGSTKYAMSLIGRSSIGRYGLFMQLSDDLGHIGENGSRTLEILASLPIKIYYKMNVGQVSFWIIQGEITPNENYYNKFNESKVNSYDFNRAWNNKKI